jgi:hypothetical protein
MNESFGFLKKIMSKGELIKNRFKKRLKTTTYNH